MLFGAEHAAYLTARGERVGVPPSLPAQCTGASAHARRHVCTRLARRRQPRRPVPGPGVRDLRVPQRRHNAFGAGTSPILIQSWSEPQNDKLFADSVFETINCVHCRILDGLGWQVTTFWEAHKYIIKPRRRNTDSDNNATHPRIFSSPATLMINLFYGCKSIGASRVFLAESKEPRTGFCSYHHVPRFAAPPTTYPGGSHLMGS